MAQVSLLSKLVAGGKGRVEGTRHFIILSGPQAHSLAARHSIITGPPPGRLRLSKKAMGTITTATIAST